MALRVFAGEEWYLERPESEEQFAGTLRPVTPPSGPAGRSGLSYVFRTGARELPVYAAGIEQLLGTLVDHQVIVLGKRINFTFSGFGMELWIGEIEVVR